MAKKPEAEEPAGEIVARGKTVQHAGKSYGPGERVILDSEEDIARLRRIGFLVDPDAKVREIPRGNGPVFDQITGPRVTRVA